MRLRRLQPGDEAPLRELRLRALRTDPRAFATRFEEARERPPEYWETWVRAEDQVTVVALDGERWVGMASGWPLEERPGSVWLARLWVDPGVRRSGVGVRLVDAIADWARERGATAVELSVTANNESAVAFYSSAGFVETGRRRPLPADPSRVEVFLSRSVRP